MSKNPKIRLGYACINTYLRGKGVFSSRTAREATIKKEGLKYAQELFVQNLKDTLEILRWNENRGIRLFRMSSEIAPHATNPVFIPKSKRNDPTALAWDFRKYKPLLKAIGDYAKKHGHRLTFHPGQYSLLSSPNPRVVLNTTRDFYMHALLLDLMGLDYNSIMVTHGGGVYGDKEKAMKTWAKNFNKMPLCVKRRLVLENCETCYSITDVLKMSKMLAPFTGSGRVYKIPIVFDIFHYYCYNTTIIRKRGLGEELLDQPPMQDLFPHIIKSWGKRRIKMHLSEQSRGAVLGKHSYYIKQIPQLILKFRRVYGKKFDLMIEAKGKERAVIRLKKKYPHYVK